MSRWRLTASGEGLSLALFQAEEDGTTVLALAAIPESAARGAFDVATPAPADASRQIESDLVSASIGAKRAATKAAAHAWMGVFARVLLPAAPDFSQALPALARLDLGRMDDGADGVLLHPVWSVAATVGADGRSASMALIAADLDGLLGALEDFVGEALGGQRVAFDDKARPFRALVRAKGGSVALTFDWTEHPSGALSISPWARPTTVAIGADTSPLARTWRDAAAAREGGETVGFPGPWRVIVRAEMDA